MTERPSQTKQILDAVTKLTEQVSEMRVEIASIKEKIVYQPRIDAQRFENLERAKLTCKQTYDKRLDEQDAKIEELKSKPGKKWETAVSAGIGSVIGAIVAYITK